MAAEVSYTPYGASSLEALRQVVAGAKRDDPMAPVTVVVPSNIAGISARRHLARGLSDDSRAVAGIWFTTLPRLAEQLAAPSLTGQGLRPATRPVTAAAVRAVLDEAPGQFSAVADHPSTARALAQAITELRDLEDDAVDAVGGTSTLCRDVVRVHRQATDRLQERWYDTTDVLQAAAGLVGRREQLAGELGTVVLYLPQELRRAEVTFAQALAARAEVHVVAGLTGDERADAAVRDVLTTLAPTAAAPPQADPPTAHRIAHASDSDDEVRCVVRQLLRTLQTVPAHRVAVLYAARDPYARLLHEQLADAGITVNGTGVRPVAERAVARLASGLLELARTGYRRGDVLRTLGELGVTEFTVNGNDTGDEHLPRIDVPLWERVTREAGVVGGDDWQTRLDHHDAILQQRLDKPGLSDGARAHLLTTQTTARSMATFMTALRQRMQQVTDAATWAQAADVLQSLLDDLLPPHTHRRLPPEEQHAILAVQRVLAQLRALDAAGTAPSLTGVQEVLGLELDLALPRVGRFGEGVLVAPLHQAVGLDLDAVFLVGLSEDLCPGTLREDALLPEGAREATAEQLPSTRRRFETMQRDLLAAMASATHVTASFPRGDLRRHTHRLPSRWLLPSLRRLSGEPDLPATEWERSTERAGAWLTDSPSFAGTLRTTDTLATAQEWRVRAHLARTADADPAVTAARELLEARHSRDFTRFDGNLIGQWGLPDATRGDRPLSPTALEGYAACPHSYFVRRVLHVEPVETPEETIELSPQDRGTIVHEAIDALVREAADRGELPGHGQPWTGAQRARLRELGEEVAAEFEAAGRTGHPRLWERHKATIRAMLDRMLTDDDAWRAEHGARVLTSELAFGRDGTPPVSVDLGDGRSVRLRGSADKVDQAQDGTLLVTDVKTARRSGYTRLSEEDPVCGGEKLQLPVYALAARAAYGEADTPVRALYWFVHKDRGRVELPLTPAVHQRYAATLRTLVDGIAGGLFPQRAPENADFAFVQCGFCNPDALGHAAARERWEVKRGAPELAAYTALVEPEVLAANAGAGAVTGDEGDA